MTKRAEGASLAALPVTYKSFTAERKGEKVLLKWATATEQNNKGFYIQRSTGAAWKDVAFVFAATADGNSTTEQSYSYADLNPSKGVTQYRILQTDLDGKGHYSVTRSVHGMDAAGGLMLFPNPSATGAATLLFETDAVHDVIVSDLSGRRIQQHTGITGGSFELKNLQTGFYTVQVTDNATRQITVEKLIVKKR